MARQFVLRDDDRPSDDDLTIDYQSELNEQQYRAATAPGGATLIVAGAGTGKTRTLIYRLAYLVETGIDPENIVLMTFTRRSAREMLGRAAHLLDGRCKRVRGGTFHAYCLSLLRKYAPEIGYPRNFTILDASDAADVCGVLRTAGDYHQKEKRFPRKKTLYNMFSAAVNRDRPLQEVVEERYSQFSGFMEDLLELEEQYAAYKKQHGLMDFDDLLKQTLHLLANSKRASREVAASARHVLVDEYQDTNVLQAELVQRLTAHHGNVTAVGDDAQSIYRFRGADYRNILEFPEQFENVRVLKLERNYRSTQPILDFANALISQSDRQYDKELFTDKEEGERPAVVAAPDDRTEARFVAQMIRQKREEGVALSDMAVLFRSSYNAYDVEVELGRAGIPFVKYGGMKLSEAAHIKDVIAHLKVVENPKDAASWNRILQLIYGIGPKTSKKLIDWITESGTDPFAFTENRYSPRYIDSLRKLFDTLREVKEGDLHLTDQVEKILAYYQPILEREYYEDYPKREQDLEHFAGLAETYSDRSRFLADLALDPIDLTALDAEAEDEDEPPLVLSTIHSAKGLEFDTVSIIQVLEGVLPSRYALDDPEQLAEELRLFYVASTRAEEELFVSYPVLQYRRGSGEYMTDPSRFIADIQEDLLEPMQLIEENETEEVDSTPDEQLNGGGRSNGSVHPGSTSGDALPF